MKTSKIYFFQGNAPHTWEDITDLILQNINYIDLYFFQEHARKHAFFFVDRRTRAKYKGPQHKHECMAKRPQRRK
jgi:hypothetical protein